MPTPMKKPQPMRKYTETEMQKALANAERSIRHLMLVQQKLSQVTADVRALRDDMNSIPAFDVPPVRKIGWGEELERLIFYLEETPPPDTDQPTVMQ